MHRHPDSARTGHKPLRIALSAALLTGVIALSPISPLSPTSVSAADVWSPPVDLSIASANSTLPKVSSDSSGNAVAVWLRATVNDTTDPALCDVLDKCVVEASQFDPDTEQWSNPTVLSSSAENATEADVVINGSGDAMAIWRRTSGAGTVIQAILFNGTSWATPATDVSGTVGGPRGPQLSVSPSGVFTVVWYRSLNMTTNAIESNQYNGAWSGPDQLPLGPSENAELSRVVADSAGNVMALWQGQLTVPGPTFVRASRFTAGAWTPPVSVSSAVTLVDGDPVFGSLSPQLAIDPAGNATAVWQQTDGVNTLIRTSRYSIGTNTWSAPQILSAAGGNALNPRVESDAAGNATALWRRFDSDGYSVIQTKRFVATGGTWSTTAVNLSTPGTTFGTGRQGGQAQSHRLAVDDAGNVTAVWRRNNAQLNSIIQSARYDPISNAWGAARDLSAPGQNAISPATDIDSAGNVIVVWARTNASGFPVIQASRSSEIEGGFVPVAPVRVFDTRPGLSDDALLNVQETKVGGTYELTVPFANLKRADNSQVTPATGLGAVSLNVTVVDPEAAGFVTLYPCNTRSEVSNVNFVAGQTVANAVIAPVAADGKICFFSNTPAHIIADINGYFPAGSGYSAVSPKRVFDTRVGESPDALLVGHKGQIGGTVELGPSMLNLGSGATTPATGVGAVSLNVTISNPAGPGFLTVYPCGTRPEVSSVNFVIGQTVANAVIAPLSPTGTVCFFSNVPTDLIVDISGWFPTQSGYVPAPTPGRVFDTRPNESPSALRTVNKVKIGGLVELRVPFTSLPYITPATGVAAVALNVTVTNPIGPGFVTVYPCGTRPGVSSVNFVAGQTVANAVIVPLSAIGELCFFSNLDTDLVVDINGYFAA